MDSLVRRESAIHAKHSAQGALVSGFTVGSVQLVWCLHREICPGSLRNSHWWCGACHPALNSAEQQSLLKQWAGHQCGIAKNASYILNFKVWHPRYPLRFIFLFNPKFTNILPPLSIWNLKQNSLKLQNSWNWPSYLYVGNCSSLTSVVKHSSPK